MKHLFRTAAALLLGAAAVGCDSPTRGDGDPDLPRITAGPIVEGRLAPGTVNDYRLVLPPGEFRILLRAASGSAADTLVAELVSAAGVVSDRVLSAGTDTSLTAQASPWFQPAETVEWLVRVRGHQPDDGGAYTLALFSRSTTPETGPAAIAVNQTVEGEAVDVPGDVDEFTLNGTAGEEWILFAQSTGQPGFGVRAQLIDRASGQAVASVTAMAPTEALELRSSGRAVLPATGSYLVRVQAEDAFGRGSYRFRVHRLNRAPETAPAALVLFQAVENEVLEVTSDIDEFTLQGAAGDEVIVFAQSTGPEGAHVDVQLVEAATGEVFANVPATAPTDALEERSSFRVRLPRAGTWLVRVSSAQPAHAAAPGRYRIRVDGLNRLPETGTAAVGPGAVAEGAIERVGDVDEFTFTLTAQREMNLLVQLIEGMSDGLRVELYRNGAERIGGEMVFTTPAASLDEAGSGRIYTPAGAYKVIVSGAAIGRPAANTGRYRFELYPVDRRPETPGTIALDGSTLTGAIDRPGDVDEFTFTGTRGQLMMIHGAGGGSGARALETQVLNPEGNLVAAVVMTGPQANYGRRVVLPVTGTYTLRVAAPHAAMMGKGGYTVGAYTVNAAPEHVSHVLTVGQTVTAERIDRPGDLDYFTFTGTPGSQVSLFLGSDGAANAASVRAATSPNPYIFTYAGAMSLDAQSTGRITLESTTYEVVVDPQMFANAAAPQGHAYALRLNAVDSRPEGRSATYVLGDTIQDEPVYPNVDIDEYFFTLAAPQPVRIFWTGSATAYLYREGEGFAFWSNITTNNGQLVRQMTLQPGSYRLKVWGPALDAPSQVANFGTPATLGYRIAFIPE